MSNQRKILALLLRLVFLGSLLLSAYRPGLMQTHNVRKLFH